MQKVIVAFANGLGLGLSPVASGTAGSLWGVLIVYGMNNLGDTLIYIVVSILLCIIAMPICDVAEKHYGKKDDGRIVADEYLTYPICMIGLPLVPEVVIFAFLTNRFFDILKPYPARQIQSVKGGAGIVLDDIIAALYSLGVNHLVYYLYQHFVRG